MPHEKPHQSKETRYFGWARWHEIVLCLMTSKGQVTIPREIRKQLRLRSGQKVQFRIEDGNRVLMTPVFARLSDLAGILPAPKRAVTLEEMDEAIRKSATSRFLRAVGRKR
jgi:antitoxin PrlF